jgi:hypothetical protein
MKQAGGGGVAAPTPISAWELMGNSVLKVLSQVIWERPLLLVCSDRFQMQLHDYD